LTASRPRPRPRSAVAKSEIPSSKTPGGGVACADVADEAAVRLDREVEQVVLEAARPRDPRAEPLISQIVGPDAAVRWIDLRGSHVLELVATKRPQRDNATPQDDGQR
jgi:hypothetical protein